MNNLINDFKTVQKITHESLIINNKMDFSSIWNPHQDFLPYLNFFYKGVAHIWSKYSPL